MKINVPTSLSDELNLKFRAIYKRTYGIELTVEQANAEAFRFLSFCAIIIENTPKYYEK